MRSWIDHRTEVVEGPSPSLVGQLVEGDQPFCLDLENPTDEIIDRRAFRLGLHPLAVEDSKQFGQRGKLQIYGSVAMMVGFGLDQQIRGPVEVHCYYTTRFLITLHRAPSPALDALRREASVRPLLGTDPVQAVHRLLSALHAPLPAFVLGLDERLDALEQRVLREADDDDLTEITAIRHQAAAMRQTLTPGRDLTSRMPLVLSLPGATPESRVYVEDLSDELRRVVADLTAIEERCITLLGLQASLAGSHLGVVTRRLAAVATIELAVEKLRGKEVSVPGGEPLGEHLAIHGQEDQPRLRAPGQQDVPVGALQGRAGDHRRVTLRDALIHPGRDGPQPGPAVRVGQRDAGPVSFRCSQRDGSRPPSAKAQCRCPASMAPTVVLPLPDTPPTIRIMRRSCSTAAHCASPAGVIHDRAAYDARHERRGVGFNWHIWTTDLLAVHRRTETELPAHYPDMQY